MVKKVLMGLCLCLAGTANAALIGVNANFEDNGLTVLEYRDDGSVWEWLDLTVTNGISFNSLDADLNDNGLLDNSSPLYAMGGALDDVNGLSADLRTGWRTVSDVAVVDLFNNFFDLSLVDDQDHLFNTNLPIVEMFILAFGDTYYEGFGDANVTETDVNPSLPNIGWSRGITNTIKIDLISSNETARVSDAQWISETYDQFFDHILTHSHQISDNPNYVTGTWLVREAQITTTVDEPAAFTLVAFSLALMAWRRKQQRK